MENASIIFILMRNDVLMHFVWGKNEVENGVDKIPKWQLFKLQD